MVQWPDPGMVFKKTAHKSNISLSIWQAEGFGRGASILVNVN
jgi:hypothetical protein